MHIKEYLDIGEASLGWDVCTEVKKMQGTSIALAIISVAFEKGTAFSGKVNFFIKKIRWSIRPQR